MEEKKLNNNNTQKIESVLGRYLNKTYDTKQCSEKMSRILDQSKLSSFGGIMDTSDITSIKS